MTSNDNQQYITVKILTPELCKLQTKIRSGLSETRKEIQELSAETQNIRDNILVSSAKVDTYRDFTGIGFTVLIVVVSLFGFMGIIAPSLREIYRDAKKYKPQEKVQTMINASIAQALGKSGRLYQ